LSLATEGAHSDLHALTHVSLTAISSLTFVVLGATFVGFGLWYRLLSRYDSSIVAPYAILVPVVGLASAWVLTGERPSVGELAGSGIALAGVVMVTFAWRPRSLRGPTPTPVHIESPAASPGAFRRGR
jgi:O-acetylserine/cysteine efflux transporter